jgi:hypothetical protein
MFVHHPYYTNSKTVITKNGYGVRTSEDGYQLKGSETTGVLAEDVMLGVWSAPFLDMRVSQELKGVMPNVVGFSVSNAKSKQGSLAMTSAKLMAEQETKNVPAHQSDAKALEIFMSPAVSSNGGEGLYEIDFVEILPRDDFQDEDGKIRITEEGEEQMPFYYRINMKKKGKIMDTLAKPWKEAVTTEGLSWNYNSTNGILHVSNTVGAEYGFPPNPSALCMEPLGLKLEDWTEVAPRASSGSLKKEASAEDFTQGQGITEQFLAQPNEANYREMIADDGVRHLFNVYKDNVRYKLGTNSNKLTTVLRKKMTGEDEAKNWPEFAALVQQVACPKDTIACALLMVKNLSVLRTTEEGLVYYEE